MSTSNKADCMESAEPNDSFIMQVSELSIGSPINKPSLLRTYQLHVRVMHGDANKFEIVKQNFETNGNLLGECSDDSFLYFTLTNHLELLRRFFLLPWNDGRNEDKIAEMLDQFADAECGGDRTAIHDLWSELIPHDIFYHEGPTRPMKAWVTYFDDSGCERTVELPDGVKLEY
jgi:hypothetical protein